MKLVDVKVGDTLIADGGFTCLCAGPHEVKESATGLFIKCADGRHYLEGQEDEETGELIGLAKEA